MTIQPDSVRNIIFDYGGVIMNIDFMKSAMAFAELGMENPAGLVAMYTGAPLFDDLEKGMITPARFRDELRKLFGKDIPDEELDKAWNALLLDIPPARIQFLQKLQTRYRTFLLSNSNIIHYESFVGLLQQQFGLKDFNALFEKAYFSFDLGLRKPDPEIYLHVLKTHSLKAEETLFIDDSKTNTDAAAALGMQVVELKAGEEFFELLREF